MSDDTNTSDELPRKPMGWPRWVWITMIVLALLAMVFFVLATAVWP